MMTPAAIGQAIARHRKRRGWSQTKLALAANAAADPGTHLNQTAIHRIESGTRDIGALELFNIAAALHLRPDELVEDRPQSGVLQLRAADATDQAITAGRKAFDEAMDDYFAAMAVGDLLM